jgi:hypothetical protein
MLVRYHKAGEDVMGRDIPSVTIELARSIEDLPIPARGRQMAMDAECLAHTLRHTLPQATLDRLTVILMQRMVSGLVKAYGVEEGAEKVG